MKRPLSYTAERGHKRPRASRGTKDGFASEDIDVVRVAANALAFCW